MRRRGFSLVELVLVIAILGILATLAIPTFGNMAASARRAEIAPNIDGIRTAEQAYAAIRDGYLTAASAPRTLSGSRGDRVAVPWVGNSGWEALGWRPDGDVRGVYAVTSTGNDFCVVVQENVDGDGTITSWYADSSHHASETSCGATTASAGSGSGASGSGSFGAGSGRGGGGGGEGEGGEGEGERGEGGEGGEGHEGHGD